MRIRKVMLLNGMSSFLPHLRRRFVVGSSLVRFPERGYNDTFQPLPRQNNGVKTGEMGYTNDFAKIRKAIQTTGFQYVK